MAIIVGSARIGENGKITGGKPGDQKQVATDDIKGEVSLEVFYLHSKGWNILRPTDPNVAAKLAEAMKIACNNKHIGYNQTTRTQVVTAGITTTKDVNSDCSALVRACIKYATGKDVGNFTTYNEAATLEKSGLFNKRVKYVSQTKTPVYNGDVLVTCSKGHTVIVVSGSPRPELKPSKPVHVYYPKYSGTSLSIVEGLAAVGEKDISKAHRAIIAKANGISNYSGNASQNTKLVTLLKQGKLIKA